MNFKKALLTLSTLTILSVAIVGCSKDTSSLTSDEFIAITEDSSKATQHNGRTASFEGMVMDVVPMNGSVRVIVFPDGAKDNDVIVVDTSDDSLSELSFGDFIKVEGTIGGVVEFEKSGGSETALYPYITDCEIELVKNQESSSDEPSDLKSTNLSEGPLVEKAQNLISDVELTEVEEDGVVNLLVFIDSPTGTPESELEDYSYKVATLQTELKKDYLISGYTRVTYHMQVSGENVSNMTIYKLENDGYELLTVFMLDEKYKQAAGNI